jgi:hypothetical protein
MLLCVVSLCTQVQHLILDPAIEHEFQHLRTQLALRVAETERAKAAYEGQAFTAVSGTCQRVWHVEGYVGCGVRRKITSLQG